MATKRHKNPAANEALKAPIGARNISIGDHDDFCDFSWLKIPAFNRLGQFKA
jgi:hypothetical protein